MTGVRMNAAETIAAVNVCLAHVEAFHSCCEGPQCLGTWSIRHRGLSCRLEVVADERRSTYPVRLLIPLPTEADTDAVLQRVRAAVTGNMFTVEGHVHAAQAWVQLRFEFARGFYVEGVPWVVRRLVATAEQAIAAPSLGPVASPHLGKSRLRTLLTRWRTRRSTSGLPVCSDTLA